MNFMMRRYDNNLYLINAIYFQKLVFFQILMKMFIEHSAIMKGRMEIFVVDYISTNKVGLIWSYVNLLKLLYFGFE